MIASRCRVLASRAVIAANALHRRLPAAVLAPCRNATEYRSVNSGNVITRSTSFDVSSSANETMGENSVWEEMTPKTRSLAELLLDSDSNEDVDLADEKLLFKRRMALSQAITLVESRAPNQQRQANLLLTYLLKTQSDIGHRKANSFRIGIAGPPGAGKSSFVEAFGQYLLSLDTSAATTDSLNDGANHQLKECFSGAAHHHGSTGNTLSSEDEKYYHTCNKIAVVCIDPSSVVTGGSILGDKTRMTELSRHKRAFVRPSPTSGALGGLSAYTEDVVSLCQVAGYDLVLIETVGLGQSEIEVKESVDMLLLMIPPGGGDDLQGIKKGIVEVADLLVVTKADSIFLQAAKHTASDYRGALRILSRPHTEYSVPGWDTPPVLLVSSQTKEGIPKLWSEIGRFRSLMIQSGKLDTKRHVQSKYWMWKNLHNLILSRTKSDAVLKEKAEGLKALLDEGKITPRVAAVELLDTLLTK